MTALERGLLLATRWLVPTVVLSAPLLLVSDGDLLTRTTVHLSVITALMYALGVRLSDTTADAWFDGSGRGRWWATAAAIAALVTGYGALATLASSAALRYDPSLQFLQLLSAMDIAWVVTATMVGVRWRWGRRAGLGAGVVMSIVCVWSIWRYLDEVGFGPDGEWIVSGEALNRLVIPFDTMAAIIAIGVVAIGARYATVQASPQSYG